MTAMDIYNKIENPLLDDDVVKKVMEDLGKSALPGETKPFYTILTENHNSKDTTAYDLKAVDEFYVTVFNIWKKSFLNKYANPDTLSTYSAYDIFDAFRREKLAKIKSVLNTSPEFTTKKEIEDYFSSQGLGGYIGKDDFMYLSYAPYFHFRTVDIKPDKGDTYHTKNIHHRLYLNIDRKNIHKVAKKIVEKCEAKDLSFYFKILESSTIEKDESLVLYSSDENLLSYYKILQEIGKEMPEITKNTERPVLLAGLLDGWIGYGTDPDIPGSRLSYNMLRSNIMEEALDSTYRNFTLDHLGAKIVSKNEEMTFQNYILENLIKARVSNNPISVEQKAMLKETFNKQLMEYLDKGPEAQIVKASYPPVTISTTPQEVQKTLRVIGGRLLSDNKEVHQELLKEVRKISPKYNVIPDNLCFNIKTKEQLEEYDKNAPRIMGLYQSLCQEAEKNNQTPPRNITLTEPLNYYYDYLSNYEVKLKAITSNLDSSLEPTEELPVEEIKSQLNEKTKSQLLYDDRLREEIRKQFSEAMDRVARNALKKEVQKRAAKASTSTEQQETQRKFVISPTATEQNEPLATSTSPQYQQKSVAQSQQSQSNDLTERLDETELSQEVAKQVNKIKDQSSPVVSDIDAKVSPQEKPLKEQPTTPTSVKENYENSPSSSYRFKREDIIQDELLTPINRPVQNIDFAEEEQTQQTEPMSSTGFTPAPDQHSTLATSSYRLQRNKIIQDELSKKAVFPTSSQEELYNMIKGQIIQDDLAKPRQK